MDEGVKKAKKEPVPGVVGQREKVQSEDQGIDADERLLEKNYSLIVESVPSGIGMTNHRGRIL